MESTFNHIRFKSHGPKQPNSIKISSDNQIAVKVSQSVYILTQNLSSSQQFSFYKTVIKCQQLGSLNLMGTEDVHDYRREMLEKESFHQVDWSPSGCTKRNSCLLIVVSGSSKVYIFGPTNDPYVSKWDKIHDLSVLLVKHYICNENNVTVSKKYVDKVETMSACWSDTFQPALITTSTLSSLMATGSKNGSIVIWSYCNEIPRIISEFQAFDDSWVILMDFSKWIKDNDEARCFLCAADHNGCVKSFLFKLSFKSDGAIGCEVSLYEEICGGDLRNCQSLLFYKCPYNETAPLCAISKGSRLFVWSTSGNSKTGNSFGTVSSLKIPSNFGTGGLVWGASPDELRVYTIDGKAFKVEVSSRRLKLLLDFTEALRNQAVIFKEHCFVNEEDHDTQDNKKNNYTKDIRIYGVFTTFNCLTDFVLFQVGASSELYYNIAKFDESFFFPLPMHSNNDLSLESFLFERFKKLIHQKQLTESYSPSHLFWDIIIYSQNDANTLVGEAESFFYRFMSILMKGYVDSSAVVEEIVAEENTIGNNYGGHSSWDEAVLLELNPKLFQNISLNCLKLMNFYCICLKSSVSENFKEKITEALKQNNILILSFYLKLIFNLLLNSNLRKVLISSVVKRDLNLQKFLELSWKIVFKNLPFMNHLRKTLQKFSQYLNDLEKELSSNQETASFCDYFSQSLQFSITHKEDEEVLLNEDFFILVNEKCPCCNSGLLLNNYWEGICAKNHCWERCSVTFAICESPYILSCLGCNRKLLFFEEELKNLNKTGDNFENESVEHNFVLCLLQYISSQCIYCGSRFKKPDLTNYKI